ncbi:MAG: hypothetical protein IJN20_04140 [Oscillospiraceae bacterium]|nr:hypothetical protein [Oscillospiraceae bacterium]
MRIPIPVPIRYQYKVYKYSPKLTQRSKAVGYFIGGPTFLVYALFWYCILFAILTSIGIPDSPAIIVGFASLYPLHRILKKIRENAFRKLDEQYIKEIQALQDTDPQKYYQILMELRGVK